MKRAEDTPKKGAPAYMSTYGDMMTLLLCFFVLLFAMSSIDSSKFQAFINSYSGSTGVLDGGEIIMSEHGMLGSGVKQFPNTPQTTINSQQTASQNKELQGIKEALEVFIYEEALESKVGVEKRGDSIIIQFSDVLLFQSGKAVLKEQAKEVLSVLAMELNTYTQKGYRLRFEGHTDNVPMKSQQFPSNWELSASRAIAVAQYFIQEQQFSPTIISAEGFGEHMPIADNTTPEGRAMNRRVEIKLTKKNE